MSERKINLEEIIRKYNFNCNDVSLNRNKNMLQEFGKQILELAAENADTKSIVFISGKIQTTTEVVDKQSILDIIKQVE